MPSTRIVPYPISANANEGSSTKKKKQSPYIIQSF